MYSGPITVSATATIKAIAYSSGMADSGIATATYTIQLPVAIPTFSPASGTYTSVQMVTISTTTSGASIRYTLDGSTPSETAGTLYSGPITVSANATINAIAYKSGYTDSAIATANYSITLWYNNAWANRKPITINHAQVTGGSSLTSYPMLFSVTDAALMTSANGGGMGKPDGTDVLFTAADGATKLNHEIESYNPSTGQLVAWVQIPTLSATTDTLIYIYYGNAAASDQQNKTAVWDSNFDAVWHFKNTTALDLTDSTANGTNGADYGATPVAGEITGGAGFGGPFGEYLNAGNPAALQITSAITLETWVQFTGGFGSDYPRILSKFTGSTGFELLMASSSDMTPNTLYLQTGVNGTLRSARANSALVPNTWYHLVGTYDGNTLRLYINGALQNWQDQLSGAIGGSSISLNVGRGSFGGGYWTGLLDEIRVSNIARSGSWITTEYNNESSPSTFYTVGSASASGTAESPTFSPPAGAYSTTQTVAISTTTSGASIRYTTDGTTPSETAGTLYSGPISVSATTTVKAIAYATGLADSSVASATFTIQPIVATPTLTPVAGVYTSAQTVTIGTTTSGASIRYTTDGSTPSETAGTVYSGPITVNASTTINAIAYASGMTDSTVATASYTISTWYNTAWSNRKAITISHAQVAGSSGLTNYPMLFSVTDTALKSATNGGGVGKADGTDILFTASDGATKLNHEIESYNPTTGQLIAWVQIPTLSNTTDTLVYIYYGNTAASNQQNPTGVWDSNYVAVWHMNDASGTVHDSTVNANHLTGSNGGVSYGASGQIGQGIGFSSNGYLTTSAGTLTNLPTGNTLYSIETWFSTTTSGPNQGFVGWGNYGSNNQVNAFRTNGGSGYVNYWWADDLTTSGPAFNTNTSYSAAVVFDGTTRTIFHNGSVVTSDGPMGHNAANQNFRVAETNTGEYFNGTLDEVRISSAPRSAGWIATEYNNESSPSTFYTVGAASGSGVDGTPAFSPAAGTYTSAQTVTITSTTPGASIRYTTDGSTPSETAGTVYSGAITVSATTTIKAIAYASGMADSAVASATYAIAPLAGTPTFSPAAGLYNSVQSVTISSTTSGASIRYTTDGSTPSETAGTLYSGPITVNASVTINAIAYESGYTESAITSASYAIVGTNWYSPYWSDRKSITIAHSQVSGSANLSNFPVLISVTDANLATTSNGGSVGVANGSDILFTASDGATKLNHEIESYNPTTGQLIAWVQVPTVSPATDTIIFVYYGNPSAINQQNATGVWDSNFKLVYHLPNGTTLSGNDSTSNGNAGTLVNSPSATSGEIGGAASFNGSSTQYIATPYIGPASLTPFTASFWIATTSTGQPAGKNTAAIMGWGNGGSCGNPGYFVIASVDGLGRGADSTGLQIDSPCVGYTQWPNAIVYDGNWQYVVLACDGSNCSAYRNGVQQSGTANQLPTGTGDNVKIAMGDFNDSGPFTGQLDEVRLSTTARSPGWITTEYNNQSSPATFLSLGAQQGSSDPPPVATPTFSPVAGTYVSAQSVTISTTTSGAAIRYTTDGSTPSETAGTLYSGPVSVSANMTIKAIAYESGYTDSVVASASYTIAPAVVTPSFSPVAGTYGSSQSITISTTTSGATIRYTTDGSTPAETTGTLYSAPVSVNTTTTLQAIAYESGFTDSAVASATFTISASVATPTFSPAAGSYTTGPSVSISTTTSGASIRYTTDGSAPSETAGTVYSGPITVSTTTTIKAIAYASGFSDSQVASATYTIQPPVATPTFTPVSGTYTSPPTITIATTTAGASIRYTTDGSTPTETTGILYGAPVSIIATTTVRAIAYASGMTDSAIASASYTISPATPNVTSVSPTTAVGGATVTIYGSGFGSAQGTGTVWLGSTLGSVVTWSDTQVVANVAANSVTGTARVQQGGTWSNSVTFTVNTATISSISPTNGLPGTTTVTINGSGFGSAQGNGQVTLGTTNGVVQSWSDSQIIALVGTGALSGNAQVLQNGVYSNAVPFAVNVPQLSSISPTSGVSGTTVTFTGSGFGSTQGSGVVTLGSANGVVQSWSDTQVVATVAATAGSGIARIQQGGFVSNAKGFMVPGGVAGTLAPNLLNMIVGDTHTIQALSASNQPITGLTWTTSDSTIVSLSTDDPPILTAAAAGHVTITAGGASADVTVSSVSLALGTTLWSNPGDGSGVYSIVPAVPSPTGVADVFAIQNDNTIAAITSDGTTAWTASFDPIIQPMPDFLGGLVGATSDTNNIGYIASIVRFDGMTGQSQALFTPSAQTTEPGLYSLRVHSDGTIFMLQDNLTSGGPNGQAIVSQIVGIDPSGGQKFSVPLWSGCVQTVWGENWTANNVLFYDSIIAGDGYYYLAYACADLTPVAQYPDGLNEFMVHRRLIRIDTSGNATDVPVADSRSIDPYFGMALGKARMITNADQGVVVIWRPWYDGATFSTQQNLMAITSGSSVAVTNGPQPGNEAEGDVFLPALQLQDGSFVGSYYDDNDNPNMVAFDIGGNVLWTVPNDTPKIATEDGGVVGQSGITYDQNGSATAVIANLPIQSWTLNEYRIGSIDQVSLSPILYALSWLAFQGTTTAHFRTDSIANRNVKNTLGPTTWRRFANSHCGAVFGNSQGLPSFIIPPSPGPNYSLVAAQQKQRQQIT